MTHFAPSGAYQHELDIRCTGTQVPGWLQPLVAGRPPNAESWLVVMPRRAGKTWLAAGIVHARPAGRTQRVDLRDPASSIRKAGMGCLLGATSTAPEVAGEVLLVDEPGLAHQGSRGGGIEASKLAAGLARVRQTGAVPVVFATPMEHYLLMPHLGPDAVKDVLLPPPLGDDEIARMTSRAPQWAPGTAEQISQVAPDWLSLPFLLELILRVAEDQPRLRDDIPTLLRAGLDEAKGRHEYLLQVLHNGLSVEQRAELRAGRWRAAGVDVPAVAAPTLLARTGVAQDPVVASHLPGVLRIHHISDLHHGGNLRANVDAKDATRAGHHMAVLAGAGSPLDSYLGHVRQLAALGRAPHLVIASGDIVNRPDQESGERALAWLSELGTMLAGHPDLAPADPRVVLVGGNHDVSWELSLDRHQEARHQWFAETFAGYPHPDLQLPDHRSRRLFLRYPDAGLRVALLGSAESGGEASRDQDRALLDEYQARFRKAEDEGAIRELIYGFERLDPGIVARDVLDRLVPEPGYLTLAVLHHPLSPVPSVEIAPYTGIINAGQAKRALINACTALVLHGHTHLGFLAAERLLGLPANWTIRIAGAATLASAASDEQNGYNEIFVAREGPGHRVLVRPVRLDGGQWISQHGIAFSPGAPGEYEMADLLKDG
jgi:3',5'-cyclic AMP phosphodiesterase CpdA